MNKYAIPPEIIDKIQDFLPTEGSPKGGRPTGDIKNFLNALHWILRTGSPWRALPAEYGSWKTVYSRFRRWQKKEYMNAMLNQQTIHADLECVMIDSTYIHAHKQSSGARHSSGEDQALGRSRGGLTTKLHAVTDS